RKRGIDDTQGLIDRILSDVDWYSAQVLQRPASTTWAGHSKQIRARLQYLRNDLAPDHNQDLKLYYLNSAVLLNNEAIVMYDSDSLSLLGAMARQQLAVCHKTLWLLKQDNSGLEGTDFSRAAALYLEAQKLLERSGNSAASRLNARSL